MCLAIYKPENAQVSRATLKKGSVSNSDGMGIVVATESAMIRYRTLKDFDRFYQFYKEYEKYPMMIHFRWATVGRVSEENIHPFRIKDNLFMCHNGGFYNFGNNEVSDTRAVAEELGKIKDIEKCLRNKDVLDKADAIIGYQKVIMMDMKDFYIFNENSGVWKDDVWYSNSGGFTYGREEEDFEDDEGAACRRYVLTD
jgi:predicted glutamine amidotransferase